MTFACKMTPQEEAWGPELDSLPFVQLPAHGGAGSSSRGGAKVSLPPRLLDDGSSPTWIETRWPYPWEKVEHKGQEGAASPHPSLQAQFEAQMWTSLLEGKLMAAVVSTRKAAFPRCHLSRLTLSLAPLHRQLK